MRKRKRWTWVLVFWPETTEISVISVADISEAVNINFIRKGWKGDLPWVDEDNITTLYESTFLEISTNKAYLESLDVDIFRKIIKKVYLKNIIAMNKHLKNNDKEKLLAKMKGRKNVKKGISKMPPFNMTNVSPVRNNDLPKLTIPNETREEIKRDAPPSRTATNIDDNPSPRKCLRCESLQPYTSPEFLQMLESLLANLRQLSDPKNPPAHLPMINEINDQALKLSCTVSDLDTAWAKANHKPREFVRVMLDSIYSDDQLVKIGTSSNLNTTNV